MTNKTKKIIKFVSLTFGACIFLAFSTNTCLAVDPDMQALVIDNGSNPVAPVPEPATGLLLALGIGGAFLYSKWKK